ncbi:MAG: L-iditol 2-dehydrogenase [Mesorhizobium sp.]|uniref:L-iditol 2-dehydrogenase n=1 Tax=Mesorhizobium sp. TaxID=1871066 RepID=UPI000FE6E231|nr:L-iditol 2-dehydrogenase [Mesorhizobium sp.]RWB26534.1 MAG: L-iditol 2-dehydrogenase [Mesorhizobium sp.]RWB63999.1 MAG: L-iditol 2-dehydrogenase [Mesorhizobium sp.]TIS68451.1 MAG: L-iditol 2-dehydrogenase [Mesorhizobium sp.]
MQLNGKIAVVTGGGRGIGRAIAERYAGEGARVVVADIALADAENVAGHLPYGAIPAQVDLGSRNSIEAFVADITRHAGGIDILVNNAAVFDLAPLLEVEETSFDRLFQVNVKGLFFMMQTVARNMVDAGRPGAIINMASQAGRRGEPDSAVYAATKAAVISLTRSAALALIGHGIRVNAIAPGVVETPMWDQVDALYARLEQLPLGEKKTRVGASVPFGRMGRPDEIAGAAVFLASADAQYIIGQTLNVDGGNVMS